MSRVVPWKDSCQNFGAVMKYPKLFSPIALSPNCVLKNRIVKTGQSTWRWNQDGSAEGSAGEDLYENIARGGAAAVIIGGCAIEDTPDNLINRLTADCYFDGDETELQLQRAIARLPEKQRTVFQLKYYEEMKYEEMSRILDTSIGALKASYHHAVKKIYDFFQSGD